MLLESQTLLQDIDKALVHEVAQRHSYFQLKFFLIGKEPTIQAKMWQCLRELKTRRDSLKSLELEREDLKDKLEILNINSNRIEAKIALLRRDMAHDPLDVKEGEIELRRLVRQEAALKESLANLAERERYTIEECRFFVDTFKNLETIEPLKHFDDIQAQKEYWSARLSQKLNLKMLTRQNVDTELIETIMALPDDMDIKKQTLHTLTLKQQEIIHQLNETAKKLDIQKGNKET
jgi:hypothetical protein